MGAANKGWDDILEVLIKAGGRLDVQDAQGRTPIRWAKGEFIALHPPEEKPSTIALIEKYARAWCGRRHTMNRFLFTGGLVFVVVAANAPHAQVRPEVRLTASAQATAVKKPDTTSTATNDQALVDNAVRPATTRDVVWQPESCGTRRHGAGGSSRDLRKSDSQGASGADAARRHARPERATLDGFAGRLETNLDRAAALAPNPGSHLLHRMNRTEYANAIRDLLHLDVDATTLLPADDSSEGFDNIADALRVSPRSSRDTPRPRSR